MWNINRWRFKRELNHIRDKEKLEKLMTKYPLVVNENMSASKALGIMNERKITSLLVTSDKNLNKTKKN